MMQEIKKLEVVDLFCGAGGLTKGLVNAGLTVNKGIDLDKNCQYVYEKNNSSKFIHKSVSDFSIEEYQRIDDAFYREKQVQGWSRKKKEALIQQMPEKLHSLAKCMNETSHIGFGSAQPTKKASSLSEIEGKSDLNELGL